MSSVKERSWFGRLFSKKSEPEDPLQYHAVVIRPGREPCETVVARSGDRVLSAEAPLLPLKDCDRPERCSCRYQHYDDRRRGPRRGNEIGTPSKKHPDQPERRHMKGRRAADVPEEEEPISVHEDSYYQHAEDTARTATLKVDEIAGNDELQAEESQGIDPYNSGSFDKSKAWKQASKK